MPLGDIPNILSGVGSLAIARPAQTDVLGAVKTVQGIKESEARMTMAQEENKRATERSMLEQKRFLRETQAFDSDERRKTLAEEMKMFGWGIGGLMGAANKGRGFQAYNEWYDKTGSSKELSKYQDMFLPPDMVLNMTPEQQKAYFVDLAKGAGSWLGIQANLAKSAKDTRTADIKEFEYAKERGYAGKLPDWKKEGFKAGELTAYERNTPFIAEKLGISESGALKMLLNSKRKSEGDIWTTFYSAARRSMDDHETAVENANKAMQVYRQVVGKENAGDKNDIEAMDALPPASEHEGRVIVDTETNQRLKSDGVKWLPIDSTKTVDDVADAVK